MEDCNTTLQALEIASNRLNWYIGLSIFTAFSSIIAIYIGIKNNRKNLENTNKNHAEQLEKSESRHKELFDESQKQLTANHDWNRRSYSISYLGQAIDKIQKIRGELNELTSKVPIKGNDNNKVSFSDRFLRKNALTEEEIHDWICEWDNNQKAFVKAKPDGTDFKLTKNGDKIRILLINLLNTYESIGSAMQNGVLDEEVVRSLMKGPIIANYKFFILYIKHLRSKHGSKNAGKNFRNLHRIINPKKAKALRAKTDEN